MLLLNICLKNAMLFINIFQAWRHWKEGTVSELVDPILREQYVKNEVMRCVHIALLCVQEDPLDRPSMSTVLLMLNSYSTTLEMPSKPAFFIHSKVESDQSTTQSNTYSVYEVSITELHPR